MRALVLTAPRQAEVREVPVPEAAPGEALIAVQRVGICGTDMEFYTGEMEYLRSGHAEYPMRLGHEWMGTVVSVGDGVSNDWVGRRVTGDTMLGCGACARCARGDQHVCEQRSEVGIRGGRHGALAERIAVPVSSLHTLPESVDDAMGALVEPGGNALRAARAAHLRPGDHCLIIGSGTIGLLCAQFAEAGAHVHLLCRDESAARVAESMGFRNVWVPETLPDLPWNAIIDASNAPTSPALAAELVEPGGRLVFIGISGAPSTLDSRQLVLKDVTAVGVLSASPGLSATVEAYASGQVDPRGLVAATVDLAELPAVLAMLHAGEYPPGAGPGPKIQVAL